MKFGSELNRINCEVLIIGGGGAGITAAIIARRLGAEVMVASKGNVGYANNTFIAAGMLSSPGTGSAQDGPEVHAKDMITGGRFINDPNLSLVVAQQAQDHVPFLSECGVRFVRTDESITAVQFPGHSYPRNVQVDRKRGSGYMLPLVRYAQKIGVRFLDHLFITYLFNEDNSICAAMGFDPNGRPLLIKTKAIILATGGFSQIYQNNNNAFGITGDGLVLAYELGVPLRDMEFVQFYPTWGTFYEFTIAMAGARLKNSKGEDILEKHGLLNPGTITRDQLSIAVFSEIQQGLDIDGGVVLDFKTVSKEFIGILNRAMPKNWINAEKEQVVKPCAHFCMGGLVVDEKGMTNVGGLFAAGEICGGVHGANRLGGNALAEVFSMGRITGKNAFAYAKVVDYLPEPTNLIKEAVDHLTALQSPKGHEDIKRLTAYFKQIIWKNVGIIRSRNSLESAISLITTLESDIEHAQINHVRDGIRYLELKNMILVSKILCKVALLREESRGAHYRSDFPEEDNQNWLKIITARKNCDEIKTDVLPVK
jgi:succinate dehydrogenase/fumarate reductase flavoprotein subunit